jgi:hypothetical protein
MPSGKWKRKTSRILVQNNGSEKDRHNCGYLKSDIYLA